MTNDNSILKSFETRDKLFIEQLGKNDAQLTQKYRTYRNKVNKIIVKAKDMDLFNSFSPIIDNPKKSLV